MKKSCSLLAMVMLVGLLAGCATPSPQDLGEAERGRQQAAALLDSFAEVVGLRAPQMIAPLVPPGMPAGRVREMETALAQAGWMRLYKGYTVDAEGALARVGWKSWKQGEFWVKVPGSNAMGERLEDRLELVRVAGRWYIRDFVLERPMPGDALEPPEEVLQALRPQVRSIMKDLEEGHPGDIYYRLPKHARLRHAKLSFWQKLRLSGPVGPIPIFDDLKVVQRLNTRRWPSPDEPFHLAYVSPGRVIAFYEIPYDWPEGGITTTDVLRVEMMFVWDGARWSLYLVRLFGKAIPYS